MSAQRATVVATSRRSIFPKISGVPWWAAILIAIIGTALGFAFDSGAGNKELTSVFAAAYVTGCVVAVLVVRQSGVFTAVIQPPLLLFCAVPAAYWLFHGAKITGVKDILINCGYPLIERFPLMLFTSAAVLLIGMVRWYVGMNARGPATATTEAGHDDTDARTDGIGAKLAALLTRGGADEAREPAPKRARRIHAVGDAPKRGRSSSTTGSARNSAETRSRRPRPPLDDTPGPSGDPARHRRPRPVRDVDADAELPAAPRRRPKPVRDPDLRTQPPREIRRDPHTRYSRPSARSSRFDPYEPVEPYEPPPRRRPAPEPANRTHHPISQVRYRGAGRPRGAQSSAAESWEYDG